MLRMPWCARVRTRAFVVRSSLRSVNNALTFLAHPLRPYPAETKKPRDACVIERGEEFCKAEIEAHKQCLRNDGFVL